MMRRLLLFDIDGTLVQVHASSKFVLAAALERVYGTAGGAATLSLAGKVDRQIILEAMTGSGWPTDEVEQRLPQVAMEMKALGWQYYGPGNGIRPCPGVPELLAVLSKSAEFCLGLVTGNMATTSPIKLEGAGLDPTLFAIGAYGSDASDRNELPAIALARAAEHYGVAFSSQNALIIGDTPADIACARHAGIPVLAVATGGYPLDALARYRPEFLLEDLRHTADVLRLLRGHW